MPLSRVNPLPAEVLVDRVDDAELPGQPLGAQPVGDRQPRRVVGEHEVVVAELDRGERHLLDRRAAVGPVRVRVQVAAQRGAQLGAARGQRAAVLALELRPAGPGSSPRDGRGDHLRASSRRPRASSVSVPSSTAGRDLVADSGRIAAAAPRNALTL